MKKLLSIVFVAMMALSLTGCGPKVGSVTVGEDKTTIKEILNDESLAQNYNGKKATIVDTVKSVEEASEDDSLTLTLYNAFSDYEIAVGIQCENSYIIVDDSFDLSQYKEGDTITVTGEMGTDDGIYVYAQSIE